MTLWGHKSHYNEDDWHPSVIYHTIWYGIHTSFLQCALVYKMNNQEL